MADLLSTGLSALRANQRALDVTSHNIANVNTPGYSRQRAEMATRTPEPLANGWVGTGVDVTTVRRTFDEFLALQSRGSGTNLQRFDTYAAYAERVSNLFGDSSSGLPSAPQKFSNALQDVASSPASIPARQVMLGEAQSLVDRLKGFDTQLRELNAEIDQRLTSEVGEINSLATNIARLNAEIESGISRTGEPPNDLLDQRDRLIDQLGGHVNASIVKQDNGTVNVFVGNGQTLVLGTQATKFITQASASDPTQRTVAVQSPSGGVDVSANLNGGSLGGLLEFRADMLNPARNALGRVAIAVAEQVNTQSRAGMDLTGALGTNLFGIGAVTSVPLTSNGGSASLAVTRASLAGLTTADYELSNTGSGWTLTRQDTGASVTLTGTGTALDPLRGDGLSIVVSGTATAGDRFLIRPTRDAVQGMSLLVSDPARIAAAAPIRTAAAAANTGGATISAGEVLDPTNAALRNPVTIQFTSPTTYTVNGAGSFTYASGGNIDVNGWRIAINGTAATGDTFTVSDNTGGTGDNRNALRIADSLRSTSLDGGTRSIDGAVSAFVGDIGVQTRFAQTNRDAQQIVHNDDLAALDAVTGVNLDEEAANMLRYQQAYQASAELIRIASSLFDTLLGATRR